MMNLHVYRARDQKATRYTVQLGTVALRVTNPPRRRFPCNRCKQPRIAQNLKVHVYYDGTYFFCIAGKGCAA